jgi:hypothetical protein
MVTCDAPNCRQVTSYATAAEYAELGAAGWRKGPGEPPAWFACPDHSGAPRAIQDALL